MNRRSFLSTILKAAAAPMVLPAALTYARSWKPVNGIVVPPREALISTQYILVCAWFDEAGNKVDYRPEGPLDWKAGLVLKPIGYKWGWDGETHQLPPRILGGLH